MLHIPGLGFEEYADLAAEDVKQAVKDAGDAVKDDIRSHAPRSI